jgi:hypothetical protein
MFETRSRFGFGEGLTIARRLRVMRRHTTRWFLPAVRSLPVRAAHEEHPVGATREPRDSIYAARRVKRTHPLH